jgi:hypothetical protein
MLVLSQTRFSFWNGSFGEKGTCPFSIAHFQHSLIIPISFWMVIAYGCLGALVLCFTRHACQSFHLR